MIALAARQVFTGSEILDGATVLVEAGRIVSVRAGIEHGAVLVDGLLSPGLIDIQVNGGGGVLFNDAPSIDALKAITSAHVRLGTTALMATLISDERKKAAAAIEAVDLGIRQGIPGLMGLHLEGPWLSEPRRGVHPQQFLRSLDADDLRSLTATRAFPLMVTVAPEQASPEDVKMLAAAGIRVCIGHTAAPHPEVQALLQAGAVGFTHLFNAMPPLEGRNPGPVGVALAERTAWAGLILDGIHVHPISARAAFAAKGPSRLMLVSDAMATVGAASPSMDLFGQPITVREGALRTRDGTLAGAHLDLGAAIRNAIEMLGATREEALRMATSTPAEFLGVADQRGCIAPGARADLVLFSNDLQVLKVWVGGEELD